MLNVTGKCKLIKTRKIGKVVVGSAYWSFKNKDDEEWTTEFIDVVFVGKSLQQLKGVKNKQTIEICSASLRMEKREKDGKTFINPKLLVFEAVPFVDLDKVEDENIPF